VKRRVSKGTSEGREGREKAETRGGGRAREVRKGGKGRDRLGRGCKGTDEKGEREGKYQIDLLLDDPGG